jgi:uncharacterized membrane protein
MSRVKTILLYVMAAFYVFAGYNHLVNPEFYLAIMPPNLPEPELLNLLSGLAEIVLGVFLLDHEHVLWRPGEQSRFWWPSFPQTSMRPQQT